MPLIDDRYELLDVIASGGMATVWRARDIRLDRVVALKRPHPAAPGDDTIASRLGREAHAAAAISHPNLITVYDYGSDEEGPYLIMELAGGPTLKDAGEQLDAAGAVEAGAKLADGLAAIHAAGIIHRDVKPGNVILSDRGPLLTDFGIALDPTATAEITAEGMIVATPSYAAPEVMAGEPPTQASDVYSLGVVVRELLEAAGAPPHSALDAVLAASTASAPEDRPDARSLAEALRAEGPTVMFAPSGPETPAGSGESDSTLVMEGLPISPPPGSEDPDRGGRKLPAFVLLLGVSILLLVIAFAIASGNGRGFAAGSTSSTTGADTTSVLTSTTVSTSTTHAPTTTTRAPIDGVEESRDRLEAILLEPPRSDLNQRDVEKLMDRVDNAIAEASAGDSEKAVDQLEKVAEELDRKLENRNRDAALAELERLAESLGLRVEIPEGDGD